MTARRLKDTDTRRSGLDVDAGRGVERQVAAWTLAGLMVLGAGMGLLNLSVEGVLREGASRWVYGGTMVLLMALGVVLGLLRRVGRPETFGLVLLGDLVYVVVALCIEDPVRYATPLMLLFPAFVAAWFLSPWMLGVNMAATVLACLVAMWGSYDDPVALTVQVAVNSGVLNAASAGVYVLRRRVERLLEATRALSHQDPLTGLANRRRLVEQAPRVWRQARREGSQVVAMVLDLDHFKQLNDAHGHAAGDAVLQAVAAALAATVRPSDVLARAGGEEMIVLGLVGDAVEARRLAERLRSAVAASRSGGGHAVTASIGLALARPVDGEDAAGAMWRLVDRADGAMYEAKRAGRDRVAAVLPRQRTGQFRDSIPPPSRAVG
ncbi:GGDEF domain-containing protein [Geodermatophilus sp. DSM 44513]|uniref:GGDEF domain-containing protein n=1 Tax=Geodermatophilus sp. DSM 44513 TaxID=1528104 RepID=UPI0028F6E107|nr:GGDEF domain-containing protein [Geodermatophilus sp. DSM 44513]WNV77233.1 GGDEF domain-containing protein [Geodermatophilus sp. DSM 44513]